MVNLLQINNNKINYIISYTDDNIILSILY